MAVKTDFSEIFSTARYVLPTQEIFGVKWIEDENKRKIVAFVAAGVCAVIGAGWTLFTHFYNPANPKIKPHLKVYSQKYINQKLLAIKNVGFGPAVVTRAEFCRAGICTSNTVELFNLSVVWDTYKNLTKGASIEAGEMHTLLKLSLKESQDNTLEALERWQVQKSGIKIKVHYEDIEGNEYGPLVTTLN